MNSLKTQNIRFPSHLIEYSTAGQFFYIERKRIFSQRLYTVRKNHRYNIGTGKKCSLCHSNHRFSLIGYGNDWCGRIRDTQLHTDSPRRTAVILIQKVSAVYMGLHLSLLAVRFVFFLHAERRDLHTLRLFLPTGGCRNQYHQSNGNGQNLLHGYSSVIIFPDLGH